MNLMFLGAAHEVTGSCTLLEVCGKRILIDCGMEQGADIFENCDLPVSPKEIDAICLTHAHIDHSGKIPFMVSNGYNAPIHSTEATKKLCSIMLRDSAHIQEFEAKWRNRKAKRSQADEYTPLYTVKDVEKTMPLFVGHSYDEEITLFKGVKIKFFDAGHLLGSSSILFTITEGKITKKLLFSGDLGNPPRPLICKTAIPPKADYAIIESTYGERTHGERCDYVSQLASIIKETLDRGGNVVIPSFAVGRTQELLYFLRIIKEKNLVEGHENFPVYLDSPLAVEATEIYSSDILEYFNDDALALINEGINPISFPNLKLSVTDKESRAINENKVPKVIISASGMCEAGRVRHHLKHNLWREECTILFVGYQADGTVGRRIVDGAEEVRLFGDDIAVRAKIAKIDGISSHADRDTLINWLEKTDASKVFVNHGSNTVCDNFAEFAGSKLNTSAVAPYSGDIFDLYTGEYVQKAEIVRVVSKKLASHRRTKAIFERLLSSGHHLMAVIEQNRGGTNKELARFASQIDALCEKYERNDRD